MPVKRRGHGRKSPGTAGSLRARLEEAEATLEAIRMGRVDAVVVSGPRGEQARTIEGAAHPYFVLLNAMSDGALLLDPGGEILFANRSFSAIAAVRHDALRGSLLQRLVEPSEREALESFMRDPGSGKRLVREFRLRRPPSASPKPVAMVLSTLPVGTHRALDGSASESTVLMAIVTDLTSRQATEAMRADLLQRLISAEDDERRRIARELHDETGQSLTALLVGLRTMADAAPEPKLRAHALRLRDIAARMMDDLGRLARGLHPAVLDDKGLEAAASRYVRDYADAVGATVEFAANAVDSPRLPPLVAATAYRVLQEALTNVARHARAGKVAVELRRGESAVEVIVKDDGIGFAATAADEELPRLGLRGMRERITLLGGSLRIVSRPGAGTVVRARIPAGVVRTPGDRRTTS